MAPRRRQPAASPKPSKRASRLTGPASNVSKPTSTPPPGRSLRSRTSIIPNSSEAEEELLSEVEVASSSRTSTSRGTPLQAVVISKMTRSTSKSTKAPQSVASDSTRENSIYETPGTSIPTTPPPDSAASSSKARGKGKGKAKMGDSTAPPEETYGGKGKGKAPALPTRVRPPKRKSTLVLDSEDSEELSEVDDSVGGADFRMALALQEKEYGGVSKRQKVDDSNNIMTEAASDVLDSGEEIEELSDDSFADSLDRDPWAEVDDLEEDELENLDNFGALPLRHPRSFRFKKQNKREKKLYKNHPELKTMWEDLERIPTIKPTQTQQPEDISLSMKNYQLEGLDWMIKQEQSEWKGGLLGDEMGMGKTIQAVALIMSDYPQKQPTLVLAPPVALMQWSKEITDYTNGKLKVLVYHSTNSKIKNITVKQLKAYDVILISYNSLESLYRKETKGWGRGENIVKATSAIHSIEYHRCILDEAHSIKSRQTGSAKACFALKSTYKWCLSGTPVQNRIGEFFSLLRFLQVKPFSEYHCNSCSCSSINWTMDARHYCTQCTHSASSHISIFNQEILKPIQSPFFETRQRGLDRLHLITGRIMLRREKKNCVDSMELPPKEVVIHNEFFGEIERDFSSSIMSNTTRRFDTYVANGVMLNNYANIFGLIMQMRQVADHPDLILKKKTDDGASAVLVCNICDEPAEDAIRSRCKHEFCRECVKSYVEACEGSGGDADCPRCHIALSIDFEQPEIEQDTEMVQSNSIVNRIKMENWTSSTKIEMLVYDLYKLRSKKQTLKSIVFSQFTSMLQLIEWRLRRAGFNTVMLDGSMSPAQRQKSIDFFMNNADVEVFLVSLKAGGGALNLAEASRVFIVDPWWNPAAEWQSADRCHRIGQRRPCVISRLVIEDSVESRMVLLQEKKTRMIHGTVNSDKVAMEKLTPEDMQFLFRGS